MCACTCVCSHGWCFSACSFYFRWLVWELKLRWKHLFLSTYIENNGRHSFSLTLFNISRHLCLQTLSIWKWTWCYFAAPCCIQVGGRDKDTAQLPRTSHPGNKQLLFLCANSPASDILVTYSDKIHRASKHVLGPGKNGRPVRDRLCVLGKTLTPMKNTHWVLLFENAVLCFSMPFSWMSLIWFGVIKEKSQTTHKLHDAFFMSD